MGASTPVSKDSPLWRAWEAYAQTEDYANTKRWAIHAEHTEGSLWAAFERGFAATTPTPARSEAAPTHAEIIAALGPMVDGGSTSIEQVEQATREHDAARSEAAEMPDAEFFREVDEAQDAIRARRRAARSGAAGGEEYSPWQQLRLDDAVRQFRSAVRRGSERGQGLAFVVGEMCVSDLSAVVEAIDQLRRQLAAAESERNALHGELAEVSASIRTTEFMDPPDGGDVSLAEQVRRMRAALAAAREDGERLVTAANALLDMLDGWAWTNHRINRSPNVKATVALDDMHELRDALRDAARSEPSEGGATF